MKNPFFFREIPVNAPFCDRQEELRQLQSWAEGKANVVLYSRIFPSLTVNRSP
jgi:hypothetical protein